MADSNRLCHNSHKDFYCAVKYLRSVVLLISQNLTRYFRGCLHLKIALNLLIEITAIKMQTESDEHYFDYCCFGNPLLPAVHIFTPQHPSATNFHWILSKITGKYRCESRVCQISYSWERLFKYLK